MLKLEVNGKTAIIQQNAGFPVLDGNPAPLKIWKGSELVLHRPGSGTR